MISQSNGCTMYIRLTVCDIDAGPSMKMQGTGLRIRVDNRLRDSFVTACNSQDLTAAQVLRQFMRVFVESNINDRQSALFGNELTRNDK